MMTIPTIKHPTSKANYTVVEVGGITYHFSYQTCIAFNAWNGEGPVVRINEWGPTTGKHLNKVDGGDKVTRVSAREFTKALARVSS